MEEGLSRKIGQRQPKIDSALCVGCGLCIETCAQGAISIGNEGALIDPGKCNSCGTCMKLCPQGAIRIPITVGELRVTLQGVIDYAEHILSRIERVRNKMS